LDRVIEYSEPNSPAARWNRRLRLMRILAYFAAVATIVISVASPYLAVNYRMGTSIILLLIPCIGCLYIARIIVQRWQRQGQVSTVGYRQMISVCSLPLGVIVLSILTGLVLLPPRVLLLESSRDAGFIAKRQVQLSRVMRAAQAYAKNHGNWPPDWSVLFRTGYLSTGDFPLDVGKRLDALLSPPAPPVDLEQQIAAVTGITYYGMNVDTHSNPNVVIFEATDHSGGPFIVGFADGKIRAVAKSAIAEVRTKDQKAREELRLHPH